MAIDVRRQAEQKHAHTPPHEIRDVHQTACCVVGGGPAGVILALLLARQGIPTVLLESHADFDREFCGDSVHPAIVQILDEIGLAGLLLETVPHTKVHRVVPPLPGRTPPSIDFGVLGGKFPFMLHAPGGVFGVPGS